MKIAILYICTGKYEVFWSKFYASCEKNFYPTIEKDYYVFTDSDSLIHLKNDNVHCIYQIKTGWPYDTMLRYQWFCTIQDRILNYDYCYFFNANTIIKGLITDDIIPLPVENEPLILNIHSHMYDDFDGKLFHPERNAESLAYIPVGCYCRAYSGGFWGGKSDAIVKMCNELRDRILIDLNRGIVAVWHDQSHLQKYALEVPHLIVGRDIISSEEFSKKDICRIMFVDKTKFGGQDKLRDVSFIVRIKHLPVQVYRKMLQVATLFHMEKVLRRIIHLFRR